MDKPKLIYKYTHAQAVADGVLRRIPWPVRVPDGPPIPLYMSGDASILLHGVDDDTIAHAAAFALLMAGTFARWPERMKCSHNGVDYEIERGYAIRDDDQTEHICTIVAPGER